MKVYVAIDLSDRSDSAILFTSKVKAEHYARHINQSDYDGEEIYTVEVHEFEISKQGILKAISAGGYICGGGDIGYNLE
tara:strand:- start:265 stop:501 length:237 start_codon:yes stop_codon:yes gene_type:complete